MEMAALHNKVMIVKEELLVHFISSHLSRSATSSAVSMSTGSWCRLLVM